MKLVLTVFATVFIAELGDKTQISTVLFASSPGYSKWAVFVGAALALLASSALGVFAGALVGARLDPRVLARLAGITFIAVGIWTFLKA